MTKKLPKPLIAIYAHGSNTPFTGGQCVGSGMWLNIGNSWYRITEKSQHKVWTKIKKALELEEVKP